MEQLALWIDFRLKRAVFIVEAKVYGDGIEQWLR